MIGQSEIIPDCPIVVFGDPIIVIVLPKKAIVRPKGVFCIPTIADFSPEEASLFLGNFSAVANANLVALGYTAADITAINTLKTDLDAKLAAQLAAQEAAKAST